MSTINTSKTFTSGITLGSGGYTSPLTITSSGSVTNTGTSYVIFDINQGTVFNAGYINATNPSILYAINMPKQSYLENSGTINSANGGIDLSGGTFVNSGTLLCPSNATRYGVNLPGYNVGGTSAYGYLHNLTGGLLTEGVVIDGRVVNAGTILDANGAGIASIVGHTYQSTIINSGTIAGLGTSAQYPGFGVVLRAGGTVVNSGTITSAVGTAVAFQGTANSLMVLDAGYKFSGIVTGSPTAGATNTLELSSAAGAGTVTGLGTQFVNFGTVIVDAGATWALAGGNAIGSGLTLVDYGDLTISAAQTITGGTIALKGGSLTDTAGIIVNSGALTGAGTVSAGTALSGAGSGTIEASGGTLDLLGTVSSGPALAIDTGLTSNLKIDNAAAAASAIAISDAKQTLEIGVAGNLTIAVAESLTNGTIKLDGGSLSDASGLTVGAGANLTGQGTVNAALSGAGTVTASGGMLDLNGAVQADATGLQIANGSNTLKLDGTVAAGATIGFAGSAGVLQLTDFSGETLTGFSGTIAGMNVGASATVPTTGIDLTGMTFAKVTSAAVSGSSIVVTEGAATVASLNLTAAPPLNTYVDWIADGGAGTEIFLSSIACFCRGTRIMTELGEVPVEDVAIGDNVTTLSGGARPIKWIGYRAYDRRFVAGNRTILPIRVMAGALADGVPIRDLWLSPEHALHVDGLLVPARLLVNGSTITQARSVEQLEYVHIELETHDVIFADGAAAETYVDCDNRGMFQNGGEFASRYPDDRPDAWRFCAPRAKPGSPELVAIRATMLARAEALGRVTSDPDLHLIADGEIVRPQSVTGRAWHFAIPTGARALAIASRSAVPADAMAASADKRMLGVVIDRIVLSGPGLRLEIGHDCPALGEGFHADEASHRWSDGHGTLPPQFLACFAGSLSIEVHTGATGLRYPLDPPAFDVRAAEPAPATSAPPRRPAAKKRRRARSAA